MNSKGVSFLIACLCVAISSFVTVNAQLSYCNGSPNNNPIQTGPPKFVKSVANGKLYTVGNGDDAISIMHVWGTPYQMGYAQGQLMTAEIRELVPAFLAHIEAQVMSAVEQYVGPDLAYYVSEFGVMAGLDLTYEMTKEFSGEYFFEEMHGIADATGVDYNTILRIHMLPELVKAGCSIFGAWDSATVGGNLFQLRALDWDTTGPLQNHPVVVVYHPSAGNGHAFANVGWSGWVASITGMSSVQMGMSEKVTDHDFGTSSRIGVPFNFLIRDVLQFDATVDAAITRMANARRTCNIWLGCGDGKEGIKRVNLFQYSHSDLVVIDPDTVIQYPSNSSKYVHPLIPDVVYWGVHQQCYSALLQKWAGQINAPNTIQNIIPVSETGNLHAAIYDLTSMTMWVANARGANETGAFNAYQRPFIQLNMTALFSEQPPSF